MKGQIKYLDEQVPNLNDTLVKISNKASTIEVSKHS
jgi:hypothetical protein